MKGIRAGLAAAALSFAVAGCGKTSAGDSPEAAFKEFQEALRAKDGNRAWDLMSTNSRNKMDEIVREIKADLPVPGKSPPEDVKKAEDHFKAKLGMTLPEVKAMDGKKFFAGMIARADPSEKGLSVHEIPDAKMENLKLAGDRAGAKMTLGAKTDDIGFIKERGVWKVIVAE